MLDICINCGACRADKTIDLKGPFAICPECGHKQPFRRLPLFMVGGASGVGKSTACQVLAGRLDEVVLLDSDLLWRREFDKPADRYREYFELWLLACKDISQSGRPVVLFGAGTGVPENIEPCVERRYFSNVYYLALTCDPDVQRERYYGRPAWRTVGGPKVLEAHIAFNRWFRENASSVTPAIDLLDTTHLSPEEVSSQIAAWIRGKL